MDFEVIEEGEYEINVVDTNGRLVSQIFSGPLKKGKYKGRQKRIHINSGIYLYVFKKDGKVKDIKNVIMMM